MSGTYVCCSPYTQKEMGGGVTLKLECGDEIIVDKWGNFNVMDLKAESFDPPTVSFNPRRCYITERDLQLNFDKIGEGK